MSIQWVVPHQSRFLSTANVFAAAFNVPTPGVYDFGVAGNVRQRILELQPRTAYLLERLTVGGDLAAEDYAEALDLSAAGYPSISFLREQSRQSVYALPVRLPRYVDQAESSAWVYSDSGDDWLVGTLTGRLNQTAALVGRATLRLTVALAVYAIEGTIYQKAFRDGQLLGLAAAVRGGR